MTLLPFQTNFSPKIETLVRKQNYFDGKLAIVIIYIKNKYGSGHDWRCKKTTQTHHQHQLGHIIKLKILNLVQARDISFFYNIYCCSFATKFEFWFNSLRAILCAIFANFIMFLFNNHIQSGAKSNQIAKKTQNAPNINAHKNYALEPRDVIRSNPMHLIIYF